MKDKRKLDYKAMWYQLESDLQKAIKNPPENVSKGVQEVAVLIFNNLLEDMKIIERDFELVVGIISMEELMEAKELINKVRYIDYLTESEKSELANAMMILDEIYCSHD